MKQENFINKKKTKIDYKNWLPKRLLKAKIIESLVCLILFLLFGVSDLVLEGKQRIICGLIFGIGFLILMIITTLYIPIIFCYIFKLQFHSTSPPSLFHSYIAICEHKK